MSKITGTEKVIANLKLYSEKIRAQVVVSTRKLGTLISRYVKESKLTGQVLKNRTGTLRRSVHYNVEESTGTVKGIVGTKNKEYAARHEYGFKGTEQVKEHLRTISQAWGRPIEPRQVLVQAFTRTANTPERSFLRTALLEKKDEIIDEYRRAEQRARA